VNNLKSRFSTPSLSIFNESLVSATENLSLTQGKLKENLSLSLPLGASSDKIRDRVKSIGSDIRKLRSKSCERVFQRCRKGLDKVVKREQQPEDTFHHNATLRQSRRSRTKKAKPTQQSYKAYARAIVDVNPSPYDNEALSLRIGDLIGVISQHPSGIWKGECEGKVGRFKFINVEMVESKKVELEDKKSFASLSELLEELQLIHLRSKLELNGYEKLENLENIVRKDLEYLGILDFSDQEKLIEAGAALSNGDIKIVVSEAEQRLDSGCYDAGGDSLKTSSSLTEGSLTGDEETDVGGKIVVERRSIAVHRRSKQLSLGDVWSYQSEDVVF